jgi:hypothetical protein
MNEETRTEGARSFAVFLQQLGDGECHRELTKEFHDLLILLSHEAQSRGNAGSAKGSITLKIDVTVEAKGVCGIKHQVTTREPKPERSDEVYWLTPGKNLSRDNPKQQDMFPKEVKAPPVLEAPDDEENSIAREAT